MNSFQEKKHINQGHGGRGEGSAVRESRVRATVCLSWWKPCGWEDKQRTEATWHTGLATASILFLTQESRNKDS